MYALNTYSRAKTSLNSRHRNAMKKIGRKKTGAYTNIYIDSECYSIPTQKKLA